MVLPTTREHIMGRDESFGSDEYEFFGDDSEPDVYADDEDED